MRGRARRRVSRAGTARGRAGVGLDAQRAAGDLRRTDLALAVGVEPERDLDDREGREDVDLADLGAAQAALAGDGADDALGRDAVAVADGDAVAVAVGAAARTAAALRPLGSPAAC